MSSHKGSQQRSVLITGVSSGIGKTTALELDRRGFQVFAGVRREEDGRMLQEEASPAFVPLLLDVTDAEAIAAAAEQVREATGPAGLHGLVNNAGIVVGFALEFLPLDELRRQMEVNLVGQLAVTQAMLPMLRTARGRIVNMSSVSGRIAAPYVGPYAASKHALEALSDSLRVELRHFGVRVSLIEPGEIKTPIWHKSRQYADDLREELMDEVSARIPQEVRDCYANDVVAMRETVAELAETALPVARVVRVIVHALTARRPKARYPVGARTRAALTAFKFLPTNVRDWLIRRSLGMK